MSSSPSLPTLEFFTREGCHLCEEARADLQAALEERVLRGDPIARVRFIDVDSDARLKERYGDFVPVLALNGHELTLAMGRRTITRFLDTLLGRLA